MVRWPVAHCAADRAGGSEEELHDYHQRRTRSPRGGYRAGTGRDVGRWTGPLPLTFERGVIDGNRPLKTNTPYCSSRANVSICEAAWQFDRMVDDNTSRF